MPFEHFRIERLEIIHNLNIELCSRFIWVIIGLTAAVPEKQPDNRYNEDDRKDDDENHMSGRTPGAGRTAPPFTAFCMGMGMF